MSDQVLFSFIGGQTPESLVGVSVLINATLIIVWTVVVRFNTLIKTLGQNWFLSNWFVALVFLFVAAATATVWPKVPTRPTSNHVWVSSLWRKEIIPWMSSPALPFSTEKEKWTQGSHCIPRNSGSGSNIVLILTKLLNSSGPRFSYLQNTWIWQGVFQDPFQLLLSMFYTIKWNKIHEMLYKHKGLWWKWLKKGDGLKFCLSLSTELFITSGF